MKKIKKDISVKDRLDLLDTLEKRFEKNMKRHKGIEWKKVLVKLEKNPEKLWSLLQMEATGGEPDVVGINKKTSEFIFIDCAPETPKERRSVCYDQEALESRKEHKPKHSALGMAAEMGVTILSEEEYFELQKSGAFDSKTSSWLRTPESVRALGGAIYGDFRYGRVFIGHNGAESYYAVRGFRASLHV